MRLDLALESLEQSSSFLQEISFNHSKAFQNTLLSRISITSVIRDAEPHESSLFTTSGSRKSITQVPASTASEVLKSRDANIDAILSAIEKVNQIYPVDVDQVTTQVDLMRHKYGNLVDSIAGLERDVEAQRRRLDQLSSGREYSTEEDEMMGGSNETTGAAGMAGGEAVSVRGVTEEMIRAEEEEILRLEQLIEAKTKNGR